LKSIHTLIPDIQELLSTKGWFDAATATEFSREVQERLSGQFQRRTQTPSLRLSQMGPRCPKALWHSVHEAGEAESLPPWAEFKFSFGHVIEGLAVAFSKAAGHEVTGEQDELVVDGVKGHRDCIIDGCLVDVKSASSPSFKKFKDGSIAESDTFGYLDQLDGYLVGSSADPLLRVKDRAYLLAVDKQLGHMCLYEHRLREAHIRARIKKYREIVALQSPPPCQCGTEQFGEGGNIRLDVKASYSPYKFSCFPQLRTFVYSKGPVYFAEVRTTPKYKGQPLLEIDRYGNQI
jgi:hypothetical protein